MTDESSLRWAGILAAVLTITSILAATVVSPSFAWREHALSNLGVTATDPGTTATVVLFNGGLILGGLVGLLFVVGLYREATDRGRQLVAVLLGLTLLAMALVGVFPQDRTLHAPVAIAFFLGISVTLWTDAAVVARVGEWRWAGLGFVTGTGNAVTWLLWGMTGPVAREGLAMPEILGAICFAVWVCGTALAR